MMMKKIYNDKIYEYLVNCHLQSNSMKKVSQTKKTDTKELTVIKVKSIFEFLVYIWMICYFVLCRNEESYTR